jgi:hypothetical protein
VWVPPPLTHLQQLLTSFITCLLLHTHSLTHSHSLYFTMTTPIDDIHVALTDLTAQVATHAPNLRPTVAPAYLPLHSPTHSLDTLCATKQQSDRVSKWMSKKSSEDSAQIVFVTSVDYPRRRVNVTKVKVSE